jgi:hypothetical protein
MIFSRKFFKVCVVLIVVLTILNVVFILTNKSVRENLTFDALRALNIDDNIKISWEDLDWINYEKTRVGPGEGGQPFVETDPDLIKKNEEWVRKEGFFVETSNKISVTRSLPDHRPPMQATKTLSEM